MNSKNPWDQIFALFKIYNSIKGLEGKPLESQDKMLIRGVYSRSQHNFKHLEKDFEQSDEEWYGSEQDPNNNEVNDEVDDLNIKRPSDMVKKGLIRGFSGDVFSNFES